MIQLARTYGKDYSDNSIDPLLQFNESQTWTTSSGTGSGTIDTSQRFEGKSSLKIENTAPTNDLVITNSAQNTLITYDGNYDLSLMLLKNELDEEFTLDVQIFKNAVLLDTQTCVVGSETADVTNNKWVRFQSDQSYTLVDTDVLSFTFTLKGKVGTALPLTRLWVDGVMLSDTKRLSAVVPPYTKAADYSYGLFTGWAVYNDTVHTTGSPFTVTDGTTVALPNNAASKIESQLPIDCDTFYNGTTIPGRNGDGYNILVEFSCRPNGAGADPRVTIAINIGGAVGRIYPFDFFLDKGNGVEHNFLMSHNVYTLDTWEANGGTVEVTATNENIEIYNIRYLITRTHKAR